VLAPAIGDDAIVQKACNSIYFEAKQDSPFSFIFTRRTSRDATAALEFKYALAYSNVFGVAVNPEALLEMFGLNRPEIRIDQKLQVLRNANRDQGPSRSCRDLRALPIAQTSCVNPVTPRRWTRHLPVILAPLSKSVTLQPYSDDLPDSELAGSTFRTPGIDGSQQGFGSRSAKVCSWLANC